MATTLKVSLAFVSSWATLLGAHQMPSLDSLSEAEVTNSTFDIDEDDAAFLRQIPALDSSSEVAVDDSTLEVDDGPIMVPLRRDVVPIRRQGRIVTFKTSYSGVVSLGVPAQEFRVVFDTGSGHVVVPSSKCQMEACTMHKRYNVSESETGEWIEYSGKVLRPGQLSKEVTIGFGTGVIKAHFAREHLCLNPVSNDSHLRKGCLEMHVLPAMEMSDSPFTSFLFDGIVGLGLSSLALTKKFSFFDVMSKSGQVAASQFGVFLTEGENGEESELAIGGFNPARFLEPLSWSPLVLAEHGHWLIDIKAVRVNGEAMEVCQDGSCRGVVDTGTSHIGVPINHEKDLAAMLTRDAGDYLDCRLMEGAPILEFELDTMNLTLAAENYMRRMPLRDGVDVGSHVVVSTDLEKAAGNGTRNETTVDENATDFTRHCSARLMPVDMPAPLGPNLWILGEPLVQKYYTVYDWSALRIGFSLANSRHNTEGLQGRGGKGSLPAEVVAEGHMLAQTEAELTEEVVFLQPSTRHGMH